ncbi:GNAT family N-acetyltransferase [Mesorhizobium sp. CN2-181]|uniref:GNAT family N-acetyltransferase n=1 Tax=Mesorhizobium yinganensis TaxID=3157707 RepID=UPI0032B7A03D
MDTGDDRRMNQRALRDAGPRPVIRLLTANDAAAFRALRIMALRESPDAFTASIEEEEAFSDDEMAARAVPEAPGLFLGVFVGNELVGMAGYIANPRPKTRHKGVMVAVYVAPQWRAEKLGRRLVEAVVDHARSVGATLLHCTVRADNVPARRLYLSLGFVPYGLERDAIFADGRFFDDELLALDLRDGSHRGN